ncbi:MAG: T9SS type A sorting domain-containing protein [Candidatus Zixiibacteriota bacterium]
MILYQKSTKESPSVKRVGFKGAQSAILCLVLLLAIASSASAQGISIDGGAVGGGGSSSTTGYMITGDVPLMPGGVSMGGGYRAVGGTISHLAADALMLEYAAGSVETISMADRTISVAYSRGDGTAVSGTFLYRPGGASAYSQSPMTDNGAGTLSYSLSTGQLSVRGLEYYIVVEQGSYSTSVGTSAQPYVFRVTFTNAQGQRPEALPNASYRIVSLPVLANSTNASTVFLDDLGTADATQWRLGAYNGTTGNVDEFPSVPAAIPGQGYWLIARGGMTYGSAGTSIRPNYTYGGNQYFEVALDSGWNMFANPLPFDISFAAMYLDTGGVVVASHPAAIIDNAAYYYNGTGYSNVTTIPAWEGVFLHANRSGASALVRYSEITGGTVSTKPLVDYGEDGEWSLEIILKAGDKIDAGNLIGVKYDALESADEYDFHEPPPAPDGPYVGLKIPGDEQSLRMTDFRPEFEHGAVWAMEISPGKNRTLSLRGLAELQGWEVALEFDNATMIYPSDEQVIAVPDKVTSARLIIGNRTFLAGEQAGLPENFALDQNYPNPFNPMTTIRFVVPIQTHVRLDIHNILGQRVKSLVDEELPRGEYTVTWYGTDDNEKSVATGIYFYRIQTEQFSQCRKMVLLK